MKKGWKQKHKSANIEKQRQMITIIFKPVCFGCVFDLHTEIQGLKNTKLPDKWGTLKIYECEQMGGMGLKYKNDAVLNKDPIQCAFQRKKRRVTRTGDHRHITKGCLQLFTMEALGKNNVDSSDT